MPLIPLGSWFALAMKFLPCLSSFCTTGLAEPSTSSSTSAQELTSSRSRLTSSQVASVGPSNCREMNSPGFILCVSITRLMRTILSDFCTETPSSPATLEAAMAEGGVLTAISRTAVQTARPLSVFFGSMTR